MINYAILSIAFSAVMHVLFFILLVLIPVPTIFVEQPELRQSRTLELVDLPADKAPSKPELKAMLTPQSQELKQVDSMTVPLSPPAPSLAPAIAPGAAVPLPQPRQSEAKDAYAALAASALKPPKIVEIDGDAISKESLVYNRLIIPKIPRQENNLSAMVNGSLFGPGGAGLGLPGGGGAIPLQFKMSMPKDLMPVTPQTRLLPQEKISVLDKLLSIKLTKYPDPIAGGGYFQLAISTNPNAARLGAFEKDVIFVVDVSGSISQIKLNEFKQGVLAALPKLTPKDRFQIVAFRDKPSHLFQKLESPTEANVRKAVEFVSALHRTGSTDIYSAIEPYACGTYKTEGRPLLIFLASDGEVNYGRIIDSRMLVNSVSNRNQDRASIFTFSCGGKMNTFLLDLLAYRNRGEYLKVGAVDKARFDLEKYIDSVADIIVADIGYQVSSELADGVFPKKLPNLYRGHVLSLFGRYKADTKSIGLRIVGRGADGGMHELVHEANLETAEIVGPKLAQQWAMQHIFHLYSQLTAQYDESLKQKIHAEAMEFSLNLPFLDQYLTKGSGE